MEYYTLKQYLLSLREEYKKLERETQKLRKYVKFNKRNINNPEFRFIYNPKMTKIDNTLYLYTILCYVENKKNKLKESINNILKFISRFNGNSENSYQSYYDISENIFKKYHDSNSAYITDQESLKKKAMDILHSKEIKTLSDKCYIDDKEDLDLFLDVSPVSIKFFKKCNVLFNYHLYDDTISFSNDFKVNSENINEIFNIKIKSDKISDEQKKCIEKNNDNRGIIFIGNKDFNSFKFYDDDHKVLMKTHTKNTTI